MAGAGSPKNDTSLLVNNFRDPRFGQELFWLVGVYVTLRLGRTVATTRALPSQEYILGHSEYGQ